MAAQMITVRLSRGDTQPWGFRLQGGADFGTPLVVQKVNSGSLSDQAGLVPGDAVIKINEIDVYLLRHKDAQDLVVRSGNTFTMTVQRGGSTWRPHVAATGALPSHQSHLGSNIQTVTRTSLAHKHPQPVEHIGCGYNNSARPFNQANGGDGHLKSIVCKQYNTPVGIYSEEAIAETLSAQAEVLAGGVLGVNFKKNEKEYNPTNSEVLKFLKEEESHPQEPAHNQSSEPHYQQYQKSGGPIRHVTAPIDTPKPPNPTGGLPAGQNICAECERLIVGVFCRIKDKNLHVDCFKCATCGTPLKNQGYYNYNNKLYCDVHAKLAAMQNPPAGTEGYVPIPIKGNTKLSAGTIANALNAHGYNLQTNGATPTIVTGGAPNHKNDPLNVSQNQEQNNNSNTTSERLSCTTLTGDPTTNGLQTDDKQIVNTVPSSATTISSNQFVQSNSIVIEPTLITSQNHFEPDLTSSLTQLISIDPSETNPDTIMNQSDQLQSKYIESQNLRSVDRTDTSGRTISPFPSIPFPSDFEITKYQQQKHKLEDRTVSPFPTIPLPQESDSGAVSPFPTIPLPPNHSMEYTTVQGNVIRSVIPPGKGISVNYKVGSQGYGGPRPFNQGPRSPHAAAPRSPASYPPPQQNWSQSKPIGQNPYATLPRTNASQQDITNEENLIPLPTPPPAEVLNESMIDQPFEKAFHDVNTKSDNYNVTEMLTESINKINVSNKEEFMEKTGKILSNMLEARLAKSQSNLIIEKQIPEENIPAPICDSENSTNVKTPIPISQAIETILPVSDQLNDFESINTILRPNKNQPEINDEEKVLQSQSFERRSYIQTELDRNKSANTILLRSEGNDDTNTAAVNTNTAAVHLSNGKLPVCCQCKKEITKGPFITALGRIWCPEHFMCVNGNCRRPLQDIGFVEEKGDLYCEFCFEKYLAPTCSKCNNKIKGDCLNAIGRHFHTECFTCAYCGKLFGNTPFFLEDGQPYCETDWNEMFTTKCFACGFPVEAGDRWVEALNHNYHSQCFNCTMCKKNLEGNSFYNKGGRPFCKNHAR